MLALWITCIIILPVLALVFYVVRRCKLSRFRLSVKLLKLLDIGIEVDAQDKPNELPSATTANAAERSSAPHSPG
ncbi:MAG TPA: hypothetical protein VG013_22315 [Gemmataceae bacterium]|nr:hypothetical protein [Gemmataceae bacterium]